MDVMKEQIRENIHDPEKLEKLYRENKNIFETHFYESYPEIGNSDLARFWKIRLDYGKMSALQGKWSLTDVFILLGSCLIAGVLIRLPDIFTLNLPPEFFYAKNAGLIVFLGLTVFMTGTNKINEQKWLLLTSGFFLLTALYVNLAVPSSESDSVVLAYIHLPFLLWFVYGMVYIGFDLKALTKRIEFIRHNGDLAILMAVLVISGGILTGITIGLFEAIGISIQEFYMRNIVVIGAVSVPVVATFITRSYLAMTNKIAPVIASIFSPLVLLSAIVYLVAMAFSGKNPYHDREFLLIFNLMLIGVMAVIVFSVAEASNTGKRKFNEAVLFSLSIVTVIIDLVALSAIFYRLGTYGITPNRLAVLGSNLLILGNLMLIIRDLFRVNFRMKPVLEVEMTIARYLPVYMAWLFFVVFFFPLIFGLQ
jgi:hypothetical protein